KCIEQAVDSDPGTWQLWNTLGVARYRNGDWKGTITALEKASKMNQGKVAGDFLFLAMAHWHLKQQGPARQAFQTAVRLMQEDPRSNHDWGPFRTEAEALLRSCASEHWAAAK